MKDEEGNGRTLLHFSSIELKKDAIEWLTQYGRLPSTSMAIYTEEVARLQELEQMSAEWQTQISRLNVTVAKLKMAHDGFTEAEILINEQEKKKQGTKSTIGQG